jgi:pimeloyl-ACP methyl ester carboxylesterase
MTQSLSLSPEWFSLDQFTEDTSIALAQAIATQTIPTPLQSSPIQTAYVRQGTGGTPIVLLHGFDSSLFEFRRLLPRLAIHRETWAIDLLGFGFTERPPGLDYSSAAIKLHLYHTWQTLIQQPMILVGASMGGAAAIDFALTYPDAVQSLVLLDSAGYTVGPAVGQFLVPPLGYLATRFLRSPKVRQSVSLKSYHNPEFASADALQCAAVHLEQPGWQQALIAFTRSGGYSSYQSQLPNLQQPTLILWGESDRILGTKDATKFEQTIPNSRLIWLPQCGHVPHLEQPERTATHILEFCR